jgi:phosphoserine phosphatase
MRFNTVVLDCDSTLSAVEGIDELAGNARQEIARLTDAAMRGEVPLEAVYGRRLEIVRPTRAHVDALGRTYVDELLPDAREVVAALRAEGVGVRVISGGLLPAVRVLARELGLTDDDVAAVDVRFDASGNYAGFDEWSALARSGGKREVLREWRAVVSRPVMLVGDGATDLEARDVVDRFVAFAGVIEREAVVAAADAVIRARTLAPVLPMALGASAPANAAHRRTYELGLSFMEDSARVK